MIDLICPKCQTKLPVAENKIGTRIFVCPKCAHPLDAPGTPPAPEPEPVVNAASEDKTVAPDESMEYVQEKLRQAAAKRANKGNAPPDPTPMPAARPVPTKKKAGLPIVALVGGGVGVVGVSILAAAAIFFLTRGHSTPPPERPGRDGIARDGGEKKSEEIKPVDNKPLTVDALAKIVKEGPASARKKALLDLQERGPEARPALPAVLQVLKEPDAEARTVAQETLTKLGPPTKDDVPIYAAALRESAPDLRVHAASRLGELGQQSKSELLFLRVLAIDDNAVVQEAAQKAVQRIEEDLLGSLTKGLQDKSPAMRSKAARELAEMGPNAKAALPNLVEALADKNSAVRLAVLDVFLAIGPDAIMVLGESLRDKSPEVRITAVNAIGRMGPDARFVMPELIAVTLSSDVKTKEEALQAFARIGDYAIPYLIEALEREKIPARQKPLVDALERLGPSAGPALALALKKATPEVNKAAAQVIVKFEGLPTLMPVKEHKGPAGAIQSQLRGWFNATDINKDGFLDKDELARAIRGATAKAYDYSPDGTPARQFGPKDFDKYPDFAFLCRADRDNDGKISRDEYERWAYDHAAVLQKEKEDRDHIQQAQNRLAERGMTEAMRLQREANVAQLWATYHNQRTVQNVASRNYNQMQWMQRWTMNHMPKQKKK